MEQGASKMKNKRLLILVSLAFMLTFTAFNGYALDKPTHRVINENIARRTIDDFSLDAYLKMNLGFTAGVEEFLYGLSDFLRKETKQTIWQWIGEGGIKEDEPEEKWRLIINRARNNNHYHNALAASWMSAGLDDWIGPAHYTGQSSILWAQNPDQDPGGKWSWHDARKYFYKGLTSPDMPLRERYMANAFRALGQLMHLVHDASVPAHTRNEIHNLVFFHYEPWVQAIRTEAQRTFNEFISNPISFDPGILDESPDYWAPIPIARIIDTDKYNGTNPEITLSEPVGLAEYTNANFFGENTIFSGDIPFPSRDSVEVKSWDIPNPRDRSRTIAREYYAKKDEKGNDYRLATVDFLRNYITRFFPTYNPLERPALDGGVYNDYAERLLPRAIGYSAGILKYFFRGKLAFEVSDGSPNGETEITITNLSEDPLVKGTFELYYDCDFGIRVRIPLAQPDVRDLPKNGLFRTTFTKPDNFHRERKNRYMLVYLGELGKEKNAVIGKYTMDRVGIMAQYDDRKIYFKSQDTNYVGDVYIDLAGLVNLEMSRILTLTEDDGWAGIIVFHEPGFYKVVKFMVTKPVYENGQEIYTLYHGAKYQKYLFDHRIETIADSIPKSKVPVYGISYTHDKRVVNDLTNWQLYILGGEGEAYGRGTKWVRSHIDTCWDILEGQPYQGVCDEGIYLQWADGTFAMNTDTYDYNLTLRKSFDPTKYEQGCRAECYWSFCSFGLITVDPYEKIAYRRCSVEGHAAKQEQSYGKIIGASVWLEGGVEKAIDNLSYEIVGSFESPMELKMKEIFGERWDATTDETCREILRIAYPDVENEVISSTEYTTYHLARSRGGDWGELQNVLGYKDIFLWKSDPTRAGGWGAIPNMGGAAEFNDNGTPSKFEIPYGIQEAYPVFFGGHVDHYMVTTRTLFGRQFKGVPEDYETTYLIIPEDDVLVELDRMEYGEYLPLSFLSGSNYFNTIQKGGGGPERKMFRSMANNLAYIVDGTLYKTENWGTEWTSASPPMGEEYPLGPGSKEFTSLGDKVPMLDTAWDFYADRTVVSLTGRFPGKPDSDVYGTCEYSTGGFGTGSKMADYALKFGNGGK